MHSDTSSYSSINGPSRTKLGNRHGHISCATGLLGHTRPLLPKQKQTPVGQFCGLDWDRTRNVIDCHNRQIMRPRPVDNLTDRRVMHQVLVAIGDHRTSAIPPLAPHNVNSLREESIRGAHDGADIRVVFEIFDCDMQRMAPLIQVCDDSLHRPVPVRINHVAAIALVEKLRVELGPRRARHPWVLLLPRADTDARLEPLGRPAACIRNGQRPTAPRLGRAAPSCRYPSPQR